MDTANAVASVVEIHVILNDAPGIVKSFHTLNYEGSDSKVTLNTTDNEYYNLGNKTGWYVDSITTNKQTGGVVEFKEKEGKWFGSVCGDTTTVTNLDEKEFSVQGLGTATFTHSSPVSATDPAQGSVTITIANNTSTSYVGDDGSGSAWDATAD